MRLSADLHLRLDGVSARVVGNGAQLRLMTDDAGGLGAALLDATYALGPARTRTSLATLAQAMNSAGVSVELVGERGPVASIGHDQQSGVAKVLTRAPYVRLGRVTVVAPTLLRVLNRSARVRRVAIRVAVGASVAVAVVSAANMRRRTAPA
jgi:hypothetical protein